MHARGGGDKALMHARGGGDLTSEPLRNLFRSPFRLKNT